MTGLWNNRRRAAACVAVQMVSARAEVLRILRKGANLRDETLDHHFRGNGNRARRRAGTFNERWHDGCPDSYSPCSHEWMFQVAAERREWVAASRGRPTKSYKQWVIQQAIETDPYAKHPNSDRRCSHDGCNRRSVIAHCEPDGYEYHECYKHLVNPEWWCPKCDAPRRITKWVSGRSMGGLGTVEVWTFECGHSDGYEDDDISNYV